MKKILLIIFLLASVNAIAQQNMPSKGYRFWEWLRVATGVNDNGINNQYVGLYLGRAGAKMGMYMYPIDTAGIVSPPQGLVISFSGDSARWYMYNGVKWERMGGNNATTIPGGPFETPLTFSNGLTRTGSSIKWGGTLNKQPVDQWRDQQHCFQQYKVRHQSDQSSIQFGCYR
jgi:hypothetical protein